MESALPVREDASADYEVPVSSRQPSPVEDPTGDAISSVHVKEGGCSTTTKAPSESVDKKLDLFTEDDYVNPALFRKESDNGGKTTAADSSIYESMTADNPYAKVKRPVARGADVSEGNSEDLHARLNAVETRVKANDELHRTFTVDNQYVLIRPQMGRRNASEPVLDAEDPYSNLADLYVDTTPSAMAPPANTEQR